MTEQDQQPKLVQLQAAARAALSALEGPVKALKARSPAEANLWNDERNRVVKQLKAALEK